MKRSAPEADEQAASEQIPETKRQKVEADSQLDGDAKAKLTDLHSLVNTLKQTQDGAHIEDGTK